MKLPVIKRDIIVGSFFACSAALAHLVWWALDHRWHFIIVMLITVTGLSVWLAKEWSRLESFLTRFFCLTIIVDIFGEGLLQPYHHCTRDNLLCTGRLFLVFIGFWLVLRPLEQLLSTRGLR